jgi:16S rRNA (guanine966-N2)-methyltransferase
MSPRKPPAPDRARRPAGELRINAGAWRGRRLPVPDLPGLRPTPDRVRETLFNWLAPRLDGSRCLDLFAGSGALGLEALSRGAGSCVFVESSRPALRQLQASIALLQAEHGQCVQADALGWLAQATGTFDIIFLDPPFDGQLLAQAVALIEARGLLAPGGRVYLEGPARLPLPLPAGWELLRERRAGQVRFGLAGRE